MLGCLSAYLPAHSLPASLPPRISPNIGSKLWVEALTSDIKVWKPAKADRTKTDQTKTDHAVVVVTSKDNARN